MSDEMFGVNLSEMNVSGGGTSGVESRAPQAGVSIGGLTAQGLGGLLESSANVADIYYRDQISQAAVSAKEEENALIQELAKYDTLPQDPKLTVQLRRQAAKTAVQSKFPGYENVINAAFSGAGGGTISGSGLSALSARYQTQQDQIKKTQAQIDEDPYLSALVDIRDDGTRDYTQAIKTMNQLRTLDPDDIESYAPNISKFVTKPMARLSQMDIQNENDAVQVQNLLMGVDEQLVRYTSGMSPRQAAEFRAILQVSPYGQYRELLNKKLELFETQETELRNDISETEDLLSTAINTGFYDYVSNLPVDEETKAQVVALYDLRQTNLSEYQAMTAAMSGSDQTKMTQFKEIMARGTAAANQSPAVKAYRTALSNLQQRAVARSAAQTAQNIDIPPVKEETAVLVFGGLDNGTLTYSDEAPEYTAALSSAASKEPANTQTGRKLTQATVNASKSTENMPEGPDKEAARSNAQEAISNRLRVIESQFTREGYTLVYENMEPVLISPEGKRLTEMETLPAGRALPTIPGTNFLTTRDNKMLMKLKEMRPEFQAINRELIEMNRGPAVDMPGITPLGQQPEVTVEELGPVQTEAEGPIQYESFMEAFMADPEGTMKRIYDQFTAEGDLDLEYESFVDVFKKDPMGTLRQLFGGGEEASPLTPAAAEGGGTSVNLDTLAMIESSGDASAVSPAGAIGKYQIMPKTAADPGYGITPLSTGKDVAAATEEEQKRFAGEFLSVAERELGSKAAALAAYNAGIGKVDQVLSGKGRLPQETQDYLAKFVRAGELTREEVAVVFPDWNNLQEADIGSGIDALANKVIELFSSGEEFEGASLRAPKKPNENPRAPMPKNKLERKEEEIASSFGATLDHAITAVKYMTLSMMEDFYGDSAEALPEEYRTVTEEDLSEDVLAEIRRVALDAKRSGKPATSYFDFNESVGRMIQDRRNTSGSEQIETILSSFSDPSTAAAFVVGMTSTGNIYQNEEGEWILEDKFDFPDLSGIDEDSPWIMLNKLFGPNGVFNVSEKNKLKIKINLGKE